MSNVPTGTVTFLFTDIEGSTKLWEQHPDAMQTALARHDALLRQAIEAHHGFIFKTMGDAFCAAFASPSDALSAAIAAQRALHAEPWGETGPLRVRVALHTGTAEERDGDYFGPPLNRVARLLSAGHGGQTLLSQATREFVLGQLPAGMDLWDVGEWRLKDLQRPEQVYQLVIPHLPVDFPPPRMLERMTEQVFVAREREMAQLQASLDLVLAGQGRVLFVSGDAGAGKTALVTEFARRAQEAHVDLLVAMGISNAQTGIGDPYLPFRQILGLLTGDVEARVAQGAITDENAGRLRDFLRVSGPAVVDYGPDLIDTFVPGGALATRLGLARRTDWMERLEQLLERKAAGPGRSGLDQSHIFEQYTDVLKVLAAQQPLVLVLDDLQWADAASISLLFHLGRSVGESRILILGAYRPEEVALGRAGERHPLEKVLAEFKRHYGDIWVDLEQTEEAEDRRFVDALVDTEPNRLGEDFRKALFRHTGGHPLFTVELLRDMQERGDLVQDDEGDWVKGRTLDWGALPARVEGVIEERIGRLEDGLREVLTVASVEGEDFTAQVVARVQEIRELELLRELSRELEKRHRLVRERGEEKVGRRSLSHYRFAHALFQQYVYNELGAGERRLLHGKVAEVLEALYGDQAEEIAVQLAHHFTQAEAWEKAFLYLTRSGHRARRAFANHEAIAFYTQALEVSGRITHPVDEALLLPVYEGRGLVWRLLTRPDEAIADFHMMRQTARASGNQQKEGESLFNLANAHYWRLSAEEIPIIEQYAQEAVRLAQLTGDQRTVARSLTSLALLDQARGELQEANRKLEESLQIGQREGYKDSISENLRWLGTHAHLQGDYKRGVSLLKEGLAVARDIHDGFAELLDLAFLSLAQVSLGNYSEALNTIQEGMTKAEERENKFVACRLPNHLGWIHSLFGDFSRAEEYDQESAELARTYGIAFVEISALINLGADYFELGQYERARSHLEPLIERIESGEYGAHKFIWKPRLLNLLAQACHAVGDHEEALRHVEESLSVSVASSLQKRMAEGWALRGKILAHLGNTDAGGAELQRAFTLAEQLNSPSLYYPIAFDLGQWYELARQEREAAELYGKAKATVERMATAIEDEVLRSTFLQLAPVQAIYESLARAG